MKQFNFKFLVVMLLCLLQASGVCAQNFLNQHDENGKKHGQWVDTESESGFQIISNYRHGLKHGMEYVYADSSLLRIHEYDKGDKVRHTEFDGSRLFCELQFEKIDTTLVASFSNSLTDRVRHHIVSKALYKLFHPNGVVSKESVMYFREEDDIFNGGFEFEVKLYNDKGYLTEIKFYNNEQRLIEHRYYNESGLDYLIKYEYNPFTSGVSSKLWYDKNGNVMQVSEEPIFRETEYGHKIQTGTRWKNEKGETIREE